ncbi:MAG: hypothetical protein OEW90_00925 [Betaproteobacteria bacterium]|nr:hypothetical protein [Betaproteobacteria bacterium]MDH4322680.1 hypothetical protein [Betaproteobacteria bacterium]
MTRALFLFLTLCPVSLGAQVPVSQPTSPNWFGQNLEIELRMKGPPAAGSQVSVLSDLPTRRIEKVVFKDYNARYLNYVVPCWNTKSACPEIIAVTYRVMLKLPWSNRLNVTKYTNCSASECLLAGVFLPLRAKPGEGYSLKFDRVSGLWAETPIVVALK